LFRSNLPHHATNPADMQAELIKAEFCLGATCPVMPPILQTYRRSSSQQNFVIQK
jgi:hypothetical protein